MLIQIQTYLQIYKLFPSQQVQQDKDDCLNYLL